MVIQLEALAWVALYNHPHSPTPTIPTPTHPHPPTTHPHPPTSTHTHSYPPTPTCTHSYPLLPTHPYPLLPTHPYPLLPTHSYPPIPAHTHSYPPTPTLTHPHPLLPTHTHPHALLPTHTHPPSLQEECLESVCGPQLTERNLQLSQALPCLTGAFTSLNSYLSLAIGGRHVLLLFQSYIHRVCIRGMQLRAYY